MSTDLDAGPAVMGDDGEFHAVDEAVDLSSTPVEGWLALALFWALAGVVFTQFITRYVFNDSASWTEEIARYLLIAVVFTGAAIGVIKNNHIQVDFFYKFMPRPVSRTLSALVDWLRAGLGLRGQPSRRESPYVRAGGDSCQDHRVATGHA